MVGSSDFVLTLKSRFGRQQFPILAVSSPAETVKRKSRGERDDRRDLPSANDLSHGSSVAEITAVRSKRQVVDD